MGVFDIEGLLIPLTARCKRDLRDTFTETPKWDHSVPPDLRAKWVRNFLDIERCRGMKFNRPWMPINAVDTKVRLCVLVDASKELLAVCLGRMQRKNGSWSSAFLIARCLLVHNPKNRDGSPGSKLEYDLAPTSYTLLMGWHIHPRRGR